MVESDSTACLYIRSRATLPGQDIQINYQLFNRDDVTIKFRNGTTKTFHGASGKLLRETDETGGVTVHEKNRHGD